MKEICNRRKIVFMYSGQGSQYFQMGKQLFEQNNVFKKWMHKLDEIAQDYLKKSIVNILYNDGFKKNEIFDCTMYSSPAIFIIEYALTQVLLEKNIHPDFVMGSSLGELCSAAIAGVVTVEDGIKTVIKLSQLLEEKCENAGMLAIVSQRELFDTTPLINENSEFASDNFHSHFVISGTIDKLKEIETYLRKKQISSQPLPVSKAFHSSLIDPAFADFSKILKQQVYLSPQIPVISCLHSKEIIKYPIDYFWDVIRYPILFQKTIKNLEKDNDYIYIDVGPSGTLANFVKYNLEEGSDSEIYAILTLFGQEVKGLEKIAKKFKKHITQILNKSEAAKMMKTFVFPGQGAQKKGMGGKLFDEYKELTDIADIVLGYSIKELCMKNPDNLLGDTKYTQPALYVVNALSYLKKIKDSGAIPDFVAGHSLGEYNALFAAGVFDFETGLRIVKKRAELMGDAHGGGMAAIIGLNHQEIESIILENNLNNISIANLNTPSQIVIAGLKEDIDNAKKIFEDAGASIYMPLNVSGAFHSPYMASASKEFKTFVNGIEFAEIKIPVISNTHARPYENNKIKENLVDQITHSVKWTESICYLMGKGKMKFEEVGPGKVLTGLINQIEKEGTPIIENAEEIENISGILKKEKESEKTTNIMSETKINESEVKNNVTTEAEPQSNISISAELLGCEEFKKEYNVKYAYVTGGMYKGIASKELVVKIGKAGMIGYFGTGGVGLDVIEDTIKDIQEELSEGQAYGVNLLNNPLEEPTVDLFLKHNVRNIEAAAYMQMTPGIVKYRLKGLSQNGDGISIANRVMAKISRPEIAAMFLSPAPERIVNKLLEENQITQEEADLAKNIPMADDLCAEADSGGHTDQGVAFALLPAIMKLRDEMMEKYKYNKMIRVGAAGGIGTPEAAAASFIMGADFILTGSINQCTVEAGTSDSVKELLQQINVQDTDYAPAGDMFEFGAKIQVLKKGVFFPARANKLYSLYQHYGSLDEIDEKTKKQVEEQYFKRSFGEIFEDCKEFYPSEMIDNAEKNLKQKMAMIFKWYFGQSTQFALSGNEERRVDYQVQCGPALGAFNQWVKGTSLEEWGKRHVDSIALKLMNETSELLSQRLKNLKT